MRRRTTPFILSVLLLVPVLPAAAAEPALPRPALEAASSPPGGPEASPAVEPASTADPSPDGEPTSAPTAEPTAEPTAPADGAPASADPQPDAAPSASPVADATPGTGAPHADVEASGLSADGRWIVVLKDGVEAGKVRDRHAKANGLRADRLFGRAFRGFSGRLTTTQVDRLRRDPDVAAVVPDEVVEVAAQVIPNGVRRIGTHASGSTVARIDGADQRVDADVAIVDTGIDPNHPDLNVVGGINCSTSDPTLWRDVQGHGTHVAGTVGAIDNSSGVVGVAPGVRLWAVKILNDDGFGYLSWYICGLDWITAQRDPRDASRPLFEAVNMSVAKWGKDDGTCGVASEDVLHAAICRLVGSGVTVVAAAANDAASATRRVPAAYDEVITVSALADTDGKAGGLGGNSCWSWGGYDKDDTFADFSNYGHDVDLIAPGKCIWSTLPGNRFGYSSGTSMAAPAVAGAVALFKASRPWASPEAVKDALQLLGNYNWITSTDPDGKADRLLNVARLGPAGSFSVSLASAAAIGERGGTATIPVTLNRSSTHFETVRLTATTPPGLPVSLDRTVLSGFGSKSATVTVTVPAGTPAGSYPVKVVANEGVRVREATVNVVVENDPPVMSAPSVGLSRGSKMTTTGAIVRVSWSAATDQSSAIAGYRIERSVNGGPWQGVATRSASARSHTHAAVPGHRYRYRMAAVDAAGNWSAWATTANYHVRAVQDSRLAYRGTWYGAKSSAAFGGTTRYSYSTGASARVYLTAREYGLVAPMGPSRGYAKIYVNGQHVATVNLYRSKLSSRRIVWVGTFPTVAKRLIEVRVVRASGRPRVDVDAIVSLGW